MSDTNEQIGLGNGVGAIMAFAKERTAIDVLEFKDPLGIAPTVHAVIGHDGEGGTTIDQIDFDRDTWRDKPRRRSGTIRVSTLESFVALVNRQSGEQSAIFADDGPAPSLTAVINFHPPGDIDAAFCDDRILYTFPLSDEWKSWIGANGHKFETMAYAEWIENHLFDIGDPGSAGAIAQAFAKEAGVELGGRQRLLGLSKGLSIRVEHRVTKTINLQSGEGRIEFSEEHKDDNGGPMNVPAAFHLVIPVFRGGARYSIPVRQRYRQSNGKIQFFYEVHQKEAFLLDAVTDALKVVREQEDAKDDAGNPTPGCGLPVYMGAPPAA